MSFLNKKIFNDSSDIFGLDLSDLSVKIVNIKDNGSCEYIASFSSVPVPGGCINDGEIKQKEQVVSAIKKAIEIAGPQKLKTKKVICSLPETKAFLRIISIPQMSENELSEAVKWEMEANIPLPLEQVYYDWQVIPEQLHFEKNKINADSFKKQLKEEEDSIASDENSLKKEQNNLYNLSNGECKNYENAC